MYSSWLSKISLSSQNFSGIIKTHIGSSTKIARPYNRAGYPLSHIVERIKNAYGLAFLILISVSFTLKYGSFFLTNYCSKKLSMILNDNDN